MADFARVFRLMGKGQWSTSAVRAGSTARRCAVAARRTVGSGWRGVAGGPCRSPIA